MPSTAHRVARIGGGGPGVEGCLEVLPARGSCVEVHQGAACRRPDGGCAVTGVCAGGAGAGGQLDALHAALHRVGVPRVVPRQRRVPEPVHPQRPLLHARPRWRPAGRLLWPRHCSGKKSVGCALQAGLHASLAALAAPGQAAAATKALSALRPASTSRSHMAAYSKAACSWRS